MRDVVARATQALLAAESAGAWAGDVDTSIIQDTEELFLRQFLGVRTEQHTVESARWIRSQQRADGTWSTDSVEGPPDLSATVAGYIALRLAGDQPAEQHMTLAREYIEASGGVEAASMFLRTWLAIFGQWSWTSLPAFPPQLMLLPTWAPLNVYRFAPWVRVVIVPMMVIGALRPSAELGMDLAELTAGRRQPTRTVSPLRTGIARLVRHVPFRRRALRRAERWIAAHQEDDGGWLGTRPPTVWSIVALRATGYTPDHVIVGRALESLSRLTMREEVHEGGAYRRRAVAMRGPMWDTALAVRALSEAGVAGSHPALVRAADYLLSQQTDTRSDWSVNRPRLAPGAWSFWHDTNKYPDIDDTALVLKALSLIAHPTRADDVQLAIARGVGWAVGMQCRDGGWAAWDADNDSALTRRFLRYTIATEPAEPELTAHIIEALCGQGQRDSKAVQRGLEYLRRTQEPRGSWRGRWFVHHIYGTSAAVEGLRAAGVPPSDPAVSRAVAWLESCQNSDGGWGEDFRALADPEWIGRGQSTPSHTAWAVIALQAADGHHRASTTRAVEWLVGRQEPDGTWQEPRASGLIGGGTVGYIPLRYDLQRIYLPLIALGRQLNRETPAPHKPGGRAARPAP